MYAIKAIFDGTTFQPIQPIPVEESYEVVITFISPVKKDTFDAIVSTKQPRSSLKGLLKGKVRMSADFNEPIEEMKEYM